MHIGRAVEAGEFDRAGQAQATGHGRHDEFALQRSDREGQALLFVGQHQVVTAFGVQRHLFAGESCGEFGRVGAAGDQHLLRCQYALVGHQGNATTLQASVQNALLKKLHPLSLGRVHQFANHRVRVQKVSGSGEEQTALYGVAQLRRSLAHRIAAPEVHGDALLPHALLHCIQRCAGFGALKHQ